MISEILFGSEGEGGCDWTVLFLMVFCRRVEGTGPSSRGNVPEKIGTMRSHEKKWMSLSLVHIVTCCLLSTRWAMGSIGVGEL